MFAGEERESFMVWPVTNPGGFMAIEPVQNVRFRFAEADRTLGDLAYAYKHAISSCTDAALWLLSRLRAGVVRFAPAPVEIIGVDPLIADYYRICYGEGPTFRTSPPAILYRAINWLNAATLVVAACAYVVRHFRVRSPAAKHFPFGTDSSLPDDRHFAFLRRIRDDKTDILVVLRNESDMARARAEGLTAEYQCVLQDDGWVPAADAGPWLARVLRDTGTLLRFAGSSSPAWFAQAVRLPFKRLMFAAFVKKCHFSHFLCKDDYNSEHILRTEIFRAAGIHVLGISHGAPIIECVNPVWRYLDFDIYYVFCRDLAERYYRETWPSRMAVVAAGTYSVYPDDLERSRGERSHDIVFFSSIMPDKAAVLTDMHRLACHFSDRKVFHKPKNNRELLDLTEYGDETPANFVRVMDDTYGLILKAQYAIVGYSTVALEALQLGQMVWVYDNLPEDVPYYYREIPGLCVRSVDEIIERIEAIEAGRDTYPFARMAEILGTQPLLASDILRKETGLTPKGGYEGRLLSPFDDGDQSTQARNTRAVV